MLEGIGGSIDTFLGREKRKSGQFTLKVNSLRCLHICLFILFQKQYFPPLCERVVAKLLSAGADLFKRLFLGGRASISFKLLKASGRLRYKWQTDELRTSQVTATPVMTTQTSAWTTRRKLDYPSWHLNLRASSSTSQCGCASSVRPATAHPQGFLRKALAGFCTFPLTRCGGEGT